MIPYRQEKIENAIGFFADRFLKKTKKNLPQTGLYKFLALLDFTSLRQTGRPVLELVYRAMDRGPVPTEIYQGKTETAKYKFQERDFGGKRGIAVLPKGKPDLDYFSDYELKLMQELIEIYACAWITTSIMSDSSHEKILAWKRAHKQQKNSVIDYALEFEGNIFFKNEDELSFPEEVYLTYKALSR